MSHRSVRDGLGYPTRRQATALMSWRLAAGLVGCFRAAPSALADDLQRITDQQDLSILSLVAVDYRDRTDLSGRTIAGAPAGKVVLRDRPYSVAVSPDGNWIAWDNWSARPKPEGSGAALRVMVATPSQPARSLAFDSWFGGPLAISSKAEHVTLVRGAIGQGPSFSLVVADGTTGRIEHDVTRLITKFSLSQAIRLAMSGAGDRLVVGSSEWFTVIDPSSNESVVFEARGRYASLSLDGRFLAFVDEDRQVSMLDLSTRTRRILLDRSRNVIGVGAWSPNGQYLLAGLASSGSKRLVAIVAKTGRVVDMMALGDLAGDRCVWVKKGFLSARSALG
jgi:WD40 repeat protein